MTFFFLSLNKPALFRSLALCALFTPVSPALQAEPGTFVDFRVSGIMRLGKELYRGLVESPDGKKEIVREGDIIDQWKVVRINEHCIVLSKETKTHEECLSGTGETQSQVASKETQGHTAPEKKTIDQSVAATKARMSLDKAKLLQTLEGLARKGSDLTMDAISEAVLPLANIPAGFHVIEINHNVPESAQNALEEMRQQVDQSLPINLKVQNEAGNQSEFYMSIPAPPPPEGQ